MQAQQLVLIVTTSTQNQFPYYGIGLQFSFGWFSVQISASEGSEVPKFGFSSRTLFARKRYGKEKLLVQNWIVVWEVRQVMFE